MELIEIDVLDLFSGIGGFTKAIEDAGFKIRNHYFSEINLHAIAVYKHKFPNAKFLGTITDVRNVGIKPDIITFGWPCQDNSIAGKRKGQVSGSRSGLLYEACRLIAELRPRHFIAENVPGLFSVNEGFNFYESIEVLTNLYSGSPQYTVEMQLLDTIWILPQNRERIYFVGHIGTEGVKRIFPIHETIQRSVDGPTETAGIRTLQVAGKSGGHHSGMTIIKTLSGNDYLNTIRTGGRGSLTEKHSWDIVKIQQKARGFNKGGDHDNCPTISSNSFEQNNHVKISVADPNNIHLEPGEYLRRLTEIECERFQGFPDNWTQYGLYPIKRVPQKKMDKMSSAELIDLFSTTQLKKVPKGQRYKLCGNAVTRDIVLLITRKLKSNFKN